MDQDQDFKIEPQDLSRPRLDSRELHHWSKPIKLLGILPVVLVLYNK